MTEKITNIINTILNPNIYYYSKEDFTKFIKNELYHKRLFINDETNDSILHILADSMITFNNINYKCIILNYIINNNELINHQNINGDTFLHLLCCNFSDFNEILGLYFFELIDNNNNNIKNKIKFLNYTNTKSNVKLIEYDTVISDVLGIFAGNNMYIEKKIKCNFINIDIQNEKGNTPLHNYFLIPNHTNYLLMNMFIEELIFRTININIKNNNKNTVLDIICQKITHPYIVHKNNKQIFNINDFTNFDDDFTILFLIINHSSFDFEENNPLTIFFIMNLVSTLKLESDIFIKAHNRIFNYIDNNLIFKNIKYVNNKGSIKEIYAEKFI